MYLLSHKVSYRGWSLSDNKEFHQISIPYTYTLRIPYLRLQTMYFRNIGAIRRCMITARKPFDHPQCFWSICPLHQTQVCREDGVSYAKSNCDLYFQTFTSGAFGKNCCLEIWLREIIMCSDEPDSYSGRRLSSWQDTKHMLDGSNIGGQTKRPSCSLYTTHNDVYWKCVVHLSISPSYHISVYGCNHSRITSPTNVNQFQ